MIVGGRARGRSQHPLSASGFDGAAVQSPAHTAARAVARPQGWVGQTWAGWDRYERYAWGDLAHSTHLRGAGTYDPASGEHPRVTVTLATGIPEDVVRAVNLDYLDPAALDPKQWGSDPDTLVVPDAGEDLYRLQHRTCSPR